MSDRIAALDRLLEATLLLQADLDRALPALGLTEARVRVVWHLHQGGPCTQAALAVVLGVTPRTVTGLVDALVETGFVTRQPHPTDRRATLVTLTPHGVEVATGLVDGQRRLADQLFGELDPGALTAFTATLEQVVTRLGRLVAEETP